MRTMCASGHHGSLRGRTPQGDGHHRAVLRAGSAEKKNEGGGRGREGGQSNLVLGKEHHGLAGVAGHLDGGQVGDKDPHGAQQGLGAILHQLAHPGQDVAGGALPIPEVNLGGWTAREGGEGDEGQGQGQEAREEGRQGKEQTRGKRRNGKKEEEE